MHEHLDAIATCAEQSDERLIGQGTQAQLGREAAAGVERLHPRELRLGDRTVQPQPDGAVVGVAVPRVDRIAARDRLPRRRQLRVHPPARGGVIEIFLRFSRFQPPSQCQICEKHSVFLRAETFEVSETSKVYPLITRTAPRTSSADSGCTARCSAGRR